MLIGLYMSIAGIRLVRVWLGVEVTSLMLISLVRAPQKSQNQSRCQYYIIQSPPSLILFAWAIMSCGSVTRELVRFLVNLMLIVAIMTKLGLFPFHFWVVSVVGGLGPFGCFWLLGPHKALRFWVLSGLPLNWEKVMVILSVSLRFTRLIGAFGGLGRVKLSKILAHSSLVESGWIGCIALVGGQYVLAYTVLYRLVLGFTIAAFKKRGVFNASMIRCGVKGLPDWVNWRLCRLSMLSLRGFPPFFGFGLKLWGSLASIKAFPLLLVVLMLSSGVSIYFYSRAFLSSLLMLGESQFKAIRVEKGLSSLGFLRLAVLNTAGGLVLTYLAFFWAYSGNSLSKNDGFGFHWCRLNLYSPEVRFGAVKLPPMELCTL